MSEVRPPEPPPLDAFARKRLGAWMDALLDLTKRNPLVNFRRDGRRVIPLIVDSIAALEDGLADGVECLLVGANAPPMRERKRVLRVTTPFPAEEAYRRAVELDRDARKGADEGGAWTLYVALGLLAWTESIDSPRRIESPIVLVPVALTIDRVNHQATITRHDDEAIANPALLELMRKEFALSLDNLRELPEDGSGIDVPRILEIVRTCVERQRGWSVTEEAFVGRFAFDKIVMWKDLREHGEKLLRGGIASRIANPDAPLSTSDGQERSIDPAELDDRVPTRELPLVLDADSTQIAAVHLATQGISFVLEGPPGTGKSQTITNIIAALLERGRRVLFVSEKIAALRVVHQRLENVGLGPACLQLHSHASAKSAALRRGVLESLDNGWNAIMQGPGPGAIDGWRSHAEVVDRGRDHLNRYVRHLHSGLRIGLTFRGALASQVKWRRRGLRGVPLRVPATLARSFNAEELGRVEVEVDEFRFACERVRPSASHPLSESAIDSLDTSVLATLLDDDQQMRNGWQVWTDTWKDLTALLGCPADNDGPRLVARAALLRRAVDVVSPIPLRDPTAWTSLKDAIAHCAVGFDEATKRDEDLMQRWNDSLYEQIALAPKARRWATAFFVFAWFALWPLRRALTRSALHRLPAHSQIADDLEAAARQQAMVAATTEAWASIVAAHSVRVDTLPEARRAVEAVESLRRECARQDAQLSVALDSVMGASVDDALRRRTKALLARLQSALDTVATANGSLEFSLKIAPAARASAMGDAWLTVIAKRVESWQPIDQLARDWASYRSSAAKLRDRGLDGVLEAIEDGHVRPHEAREAFRDAVANQVAELARGELEGLSAFDGDKHLESIASFRRDDRIATSRARASVLASLQARAPRRGQTASAASELGILERELRKKTRYMAVRKLLNELPTLIPKIKPCLLVSPLSVAQYLPPQPGIFDVVIFDEASQITVPDAIGAIARAKQVIVVGDTKQMPPSAFFGKQAPDESESFDKDGPHEDLESILDEMAVVGVERLTLQWHYRSRHEALIAFSNAKYYDSRLKTFPSAALPSTDLGLAHTYLPTGAYTGAGVNRSEADALVSTLVSRLRATAPGKRTFGVVTFGAAQQDVIESQLDELRGSDPAVAAHFSDELTEPVFVKNLENVQGDERDEIYFSTTYGPDEGRTIRQNFGPITRSGGSRRLNVAVTRARRKLHVFTSLRSSDIRVTVSKSDGVRDFAAFLAFAERGGVPEATGTGAQDHFDSDFEREVFDEIVALGHTVHCQVGVGGYRIDLGILAPGSADRYILGVECDGAAYHSGATARDRDRLRQEVLEGLGWTLFRVWSTDWWWRKQAVVQRLRAAIAGAVAEASVDRPPSDPAPRPAATETPAPAVPGEAAPPEASPKGWLIGEHRIWQYPFNPRLETSASAEGFFERAQEAAIVDAIRITLEKHGPLLSEDVARLFLVAAGARRLTEKWLVRVNELGQRSRNLVTVRDDFWWPRTFRDNDFSWVRVPPDGTARKMQTVPIEEIATGALAVLATQGAVRTPDLPREIALLFGNQRLHQDALELVERGVQHALRHRVIVNDGERFLPAIDALRKA